MSNRNQFEVIIVGGSYSGLAAAMALGRALRNVLVIDSGLPCNRQTPHSHNFLTQDGNTPADIAALGRKQVSQYPNVRFLSALVTTGRKTSTGFEVTTSDGAIFQCDRLVFATGIKDIMPPIPGFADCWGISVLHCPYCHGYEVRNQPTGLLGNGDWAFEFAVMLSHWTDQLTIYTNQTAGFSPVQMEKLRLKNIGIVEKPIAHFEHQEGQLKKVHFSDGSTVPLEVMYARCEFVQHCGVPAQLGCELTEDGYIRVDGMQKTTVPGVFACGDSTTRIRTVANAVAMGTTAGMMLNREWILTDL